MNRQFGLSGKVRGPGNKQWVHPPDALLKGHIVYNVKFLGHVEVDSPKGTDVVKDAIRKMKFNKHLKKAEGQKPPKVELTISVDGVTVQDAKLKITQHQYPLHRISYCADDKSDKRMFSFIAKEAETNKHECFVFDSEKCAEEITLTIGQAFDLAYRRFLETSSKDMDHKKQHLLLQKKVQQLTEENLELKARVADLERLIDPHVLDTFDKQKHSSTKDVVVGRKLENLVMMEETGMSGSPRPETNGMAHKPTAHMQNNMPVLAPPPAVPSRSHHNIPSAKPAQPNAQDVDLFGATPFTDGAATKAAPIAQPCVPASAQHTNPFMPVENTDPFGMPAFAPPSATGPDLDMQIQSVDRELMDLQIGFSQGIAFGTEDFSLADLDPLNQK